MTNSPSRIALFLWLVLRALPVYLVAGTMLEPGKRNYFLSQVSILGIGGALVGALYVRAWFVLAGPSETLLDLAIFFLAPLVLAGAVQNLHRRWRLPWVAGSVMAWSVLIGLVLGATTV